MEMFVESLNELKAELLRLENDNRTLAARLANLEIEASRRREDSRGGLSKTGGGLFHDRRKFERRSAETRLRESEAYNKVLFQESLRPVVIFDSGEGIVDCNLAAVNMYGCVWRDDLLGKTLADFSTPTQYDGCDSVTALERHIRHAFEDGIAIFEWRHRRADGTVWDAEVHFKAFGFAGRQLLQIAFDDITGKRRVREELEAQQVEIRKLLEEQQAIFENAPNGFIYTGDGVILRVNKRLAEYLACSERDLIGQPGAAIFDSPENYRAFGAAVGPLLGAGGDAHVEWEFPRRDGKRFIARVSAQGLRIAGYERAAVWVFEDIAARKAAEQAEVAARRVAEDALRAKSDFLANMSHEIRTPMNAIIGMSHLALQTELNRKQRNYIEKVHFSAENLLRILNDILDFSKIEAGRIEMENADFRLQDVMDNLANLLGIKAEEKGVELLFSIAPDIPTVLFGDSLRLGQVLLNLGNNAVKFTESGRIAVGVEKSAEDDNAVELHFQVRDSGIGMTQHECGNLFQSFSQADSSITRKYGGTGLGLAISKKLVELMGGSIRVESEPGKGSTFHFSAHFGKQPAAAPQGISHAEQLRSAQHRADDCRAAMTRLAGARLLLVEDNEMNQELAFELLRNAGVSVMIAGNGQEALDILSEDEDFDGVLMDCQMPVMDGYTATRELRKRPRLATLPIIAMSANAMTGDREKAIAAGMLDHIAKPLNVGEMFVTVARWVKPARQVDSALSLLPGAKQPGGANYLPDELPAVLPGIDQSSGLMRTLGDERLYRALLIGFRDCQRAFETDFRVACAGSDASAAERLAHTLKGAAATIGAAALSVAAGELERACGDGALLATIEPFLAAVIIELESVLEGLEALGRNERSIPGALHDVTPPDKERLRDLLCEFRELLAYGDSRAADLFDENADLFYAAFPQCCRLIDAAMKSFDFEEALLLLKGAAADLG